MIVARLLPLSALATFGSSGFATGLADNPVTFTKDFVPILQDKCQDCHRKGSMAPMSLITYEVTLVS